MSVTSIDEYSYENMVDKFESEPSMPPPNPGRILTTQTPPGHDAGADMTVLQFFNEFADNDKRAAKEAGISTTFHMKAYKPNKHGNNIMQTTCIGPGHGEENASRFVRLGDVDLNAAKAGQLRSSWYCVGHKKSMMAAAPFALAISVSNWEGQKDMALVHVHVWKFWGHHQAETVCYLYNRTSRQLTLLPNQKETVDFFLKISNGTFVKNSNDLTNWILSEPILRDTGVTRLMIGLRPKFRNIITNKNGARSKLIKQVSEQYMADDDFKIEICSNWCSPSYNIENMFNIHRTVRFDDFTVEIGTRKQQTKEHKDFKGHYPEEVDPFFAGPVFLLDGRILQASYKPYFKRHYNGHFRTKMVPPEQMKTIWFLYNTQYCNDAFNNRANKPFKNKRIGIGLGILIHLHTAEDTSTIKERVLNTRVKNIVAIIDSEVLTECELSDIIQCDHLDRYKDTQTKHYEELEKGAEKRRQEVEAKQAAEKRRQQEEETEVEAKQAAEKLRQQEINKEEDTSSKKRPSDGGDKRVNKRRKPSTVTVVSEIPRLDLDCAICNQQEEEEQVEEEQVEEEQEVEAKQAAEKLRQQEINKEEDRSSKKRPSDGGDKRANERRKPSTVAVVSEIPISSGGDHPGVIYVKYCHSDQLIVEDGIPKVGPFWKMTQPFDPDQILVLKVGKAEVTPKAKAELSDEQYDKIQHNGEYRSEWTMKRRKYRSQTANVTPKMVYSLFYNHNIFHVEKSILQHLKAKNFHKDIQNGIEYFKCSLNYIRRVCENVIV